MCREKGNGWFELADKKNLVSGRFWSVLVEFSCGGEEGVGNGVLRRFYAYEIGQYNTCMLVEKSVPEREEGGLSA